MGVLGAEPGNIASFPQKHEPNSYHIPNLIVHTDQFSYVSDRQLKV